MLVSSANFCPVLCVGEVIYVWNLTSSIICTVGILILSTFFLLGVPILFAYGQIILEMYFATIKHTISTADKTNRYTIEHNYRQLSILTNCFNTSFCKVVVPCIKWTGSFMGMYFFLIAFRLHNNRETYELNYSRLLSLLLCIDGAALFVFLIAFAKVTSGAWEISNDHLSKLKTDLHNISSEDKNEEKRVKFVLRSLQPLGFHVGGFYFMKSDAKLNLVAFLCKGTLDLIITFG